MQDENGFSASSMALQIEKVCSRETLADFVEFLRSDLEACPQDWENPKLDMFLEALEAYLRGMESVHRRIGIPMQDTTSWRMFAQILHAGKIYE